jgi:hypothetical protein
MGDSFSPAGGPPDGAAPDAVPSASGPDRLAARLLGGPAAFRESTLREAWVGHVLQTSPLTDAARALEIVCLGAERGDAIARELLVSVVGVLLTGPVGQSLAASLRGEADTHSWLALGRLLRKARVVEPEETTEAEPDEARVPDYGRGRPLTLGERRALARKPDRRDFDKLLRDPHPMVMINLLANPRLTAPDLVRVCARRQTPPEILAAIARHPRWSRERRVRMALILNPRTPPEIAVPFVSLLNRTELRVVAEVTTTPDVVRVAARDLTERRPPTIVHGLGRGATDGEGPTGKA